MPSNTKEVKQRLNSINNTCKITKAMELVAASKMRKATQDAINTRDYYKIAWEITERLTNSKLWFSQTNPIKRFFEPCKKGKAGKTTLIIFTSNRGLCGGFNSNIIKLALEYLKKNKNTELIAIGNKGASTLSSLGIEIPMAYKKEDLVVDDSSVRELAGEVFKKFKNKETDKVMVAYTDYKSAISQNATIKQLYPFTKKEKDRVGLGEEHIETIQKDEKEYKGYEYLYEPSKYDLLDYLALRIGHAELYQALLESNASEHSSRMIAMKNASDAAEEMADYLVLIYNKARQAAITQEIAEISAGCKAIK